MTEPPEPFKDNYASGYAAGFQAAQDNDPLARAERLAEHWGIEARRLREKYNAAAEEFVKAQERRAVEVSRAETLAAQWERAREVLAEVQSWQEWPSREA